MKRSAIGLILASVLLVSINDTASADPPGLTQDEQIALVKQLRKEKKYGEALKRLDEMIGPVTRKDPMPKLRGWAFASVEVRKEKAQILEEIAVIVPKILPFGHIIRTHLWGNAVQEWVAIIRALAPTSAQPHYYELFVEQKRCTLMAYTDLGIIATKGSKPDLEAKFKQLAEDFNQVIRTANAPPNVRERAQAILMGQ
jgi:hypothetical protein